MVVLLVMPTSLPAVLTVGLGMLWSIAYVFTAAGAAYVLLRPGRRI
jgi:hypothetical protein